MKRVLVCLVFLLISSMLVAQAVAPPPSQPPTSPPANEPSTAPPPQEQNANPPAAKPAPEKSQSLMSNPAPAAKPAPAAPVANPTSHLFKGAKIYIAPIEGGYDIYLTAAIQKKQVPVVIVTDRSKADFEIAGATDTERAGWAKIVFGGGDATNESASIKVADLKTGEVVFGYNVNKRNSARGKQSSSEACAKHLKQNIEEASK